MGQVVTSHSVSADGYMAGPGDGPGQPMGAGGMRLFDWFSAGDTPSAVYENFRLAAADAAYFDEFAGHIGAIVTGRRTYDHAHGWGGDSPLPGTPLFVLSHRPAPESPPTGAGQTFVEGSIEEAVSLARVAAGERDVALQGSAAVRQALAAGLLDVLVLDVVPILLGSGVRLLDGVPADLRLLEIIDGHRVTHLVYEVTRPE